MLEERPRTILVQVLSGSVIKILGSNTDAGQPSDGNQVLRAYDPADWRLE